MLCWAGTGLAQNAEGGRLTVTGEGRVDSVPDMATMTLGVQSEAPTAAAALKQTSNATDEVLTLLSGVGIAPRDMQTRDLSLSPIWDNRSSASGAQPRIVGYQASNNVVVRVRALNDLGEILDRAVKSGANTFHGLSFGLQEPGPAQDEARRLAVSDAMRKAALFAGVAGLVLGPVLELSESGAPSPRPIMLERAAAMSDAVPIARGEVSIRSQVTMVFEIGGS